MEVKMKKNRLLSTLEWLGNALPHPVVLFVILIALILIGSAVGSYFGLSVADPRPEGAAGRATDGVIHVVNLLDADGIRKILSNVVSNFTGFTPLGTVLVAMLGVGIADAAGVFSAGMRLIVLKAPIRFTTPAVVFAGVMSNTAGELGYVVLIPLSAVIFHSIGRNPLAGLAASFAGVSGGYSANLLLGTVDPLLSGITQEAARIIDPTYIVGAEANWYFMAFSTFLVTLLGWYVTDRIVEPQLGPYKADDLDSDEAAMMSAEVTPLEKKGLIWAGVSFVILAIIVALMVVPADGILRNQDTGAIANSPFFRSIVIFIFIFFAVPGIVYGIIVKKFTSDKDVINSMANSMSSMGLYLVIVFFAAQFIAFFGWTNLGQILVVHGANFITSIEINSMVLFIGFILICAFINIMMSSASAQWAVTAPIFVPMLMLAGYAPETIQAAYRIGDSATNIITPMMSYFGLVVAMAIKYKKDTGIGTILSMMVPYSVVFLIGWMIVFCVWVFVLGIPVGPGSAIYFTP